jgi:hypothetical protein
VTGSRALLVWTGLLAAPVAWLVQLFVGYGVVDAGCARGGGAGSLLGATPDFTALALTVAAIVLAALGAAAASFVWISEDGPGYARFLGFVGVAGSVILLTTIALAGAGIVVLDPCGQS